MTTTWAWASRETPRQCPAEDAWSVVRLFATGVAVITTGSGPATRGTTVSSFALASRVPPAVTVSMRQDSAGLMQLKEESVFTVNMLARGQSALAAHFADSGRASGLDQPSSGAWCHGIASGPALRGATGWLECRAERVIGVGDHELVIAAVCAAVPGAGTPLVQRGGTLR
jgi:flavin reductase (DIM6/NTAB) family NADH-FMN oxidoreductase RutF